MEIEQEMRLERERENEDGGWSGREKAIAYRVRGRQDWE